DLVVVADGGAIAGAAMGAPPQDELRGRRAGRSLETTGAKRRQRQPHARRTVDRRRLPAPEQRDEGVEVVDLERPGDVCASEPELARSAQRVGYGRRRSNEECRSGPIRR